MEQVVCIHKGPWNDPSGRISPGPAEGQIVTIRKHIVCDQGCCHFYHLFGYHAGYDRIGQEQGYRSSLFRPVKKTSIECFTDILKDVDLKVDERV